MCRFFDAFWTLQKAPPKRSMGLAATYIFVQVVAEQLHRNAQHACHHEDHSTPNSAEERHGSCGRVANSNDEGNRESSNRFSADR